MLLLGFENSVELLDDRLAESVDAACPLSGKFTSCGGAFR